MDDGQPRVRIVSGPGVVVRFGPTIGVFAANTSPDEPFTAAWLERLYRWEQGQPPESGDGTAEGMAWEAAELLVAHRRTAPVWGTAIAFGDDYLVLLHGAVRAQLDGPDGRVELSGTDDLTWVDRRVRGPINRVALALIDGRTAAAGGDIDADPRSDLRGGLVPAGRGLVLTASPAATTSREQTVRPGPAAPPPPARPTGPAAPEGVDETQSVVMRFGVLVADDGSRTILDRNYVFGRDPSLDPAVLGGSATPVRVDDPDSLVSRVQARITVSPVGVTVADVNSANGTFVAAPGAAAWTRIGAAPALLPVGWSMRLGARVYTHRSPAG